MLVAYRRRSYNPAAEGFALHRPFCGKVHVLFAQVEDHITARLGRQQKAVVVSAI
jgi:hypothetical protein